MINSILVIRFHPVIILILILIQSTILCLIIWIYLNSSWLSYILFLIFLGGLIVLFMYITRLASNEKFELRLTNLNQAIIVRVLINFIWVTSNFFHFNKTPENSTTIKQTKIIFSSELILLTIIIITYLLITLVVAVKITSKIEGPIRKTLKK